MLEVGRRDRHERGAEEGGDCCFPAEPELEHAAGNEQGGCELDERIAEGNPRAARAAAAAQQGVREQREVVVPRDVRFAAHASGARVDDRTAQRDARGDNVEEAPEREAGHEEEGGEGGVHAGSIGAAARLL